MQRQKRTTQCCKVKTATLVRNQTPAKNHDLTKRRYKLRVIADDLGLPGKGGGGGGGGYHS